MNLEKKTTGTKLGWTMVVAIGLGLAQWIIWVAKHRRDEQLAKRLITEFHQQYNSAEIEKDFDDSSPIVVRIREIRSELGMFRQLQSCKIKGFAEPQMLAAECLPRFDRGEATEGFIFGDYEGDHSLRSYSATFLRATVSERRNLIQ